MSNLATSLTPDQLCEYGLKVIEAEANAIIDLKPRINADFSYACQLLLACKGRAVVTGMGKSGHIGRKIAATLASTGTPALFVHPGEASHGDLGMITEQDVVIALSNSGETSEVLTILPLIKRLGAPLIAMTGKPSSTLAKQADVNLDTSVNKEACPLNLAPSSSTTASLVMGDALALSLIEARGFTHDDFARSHPAGSLGRRLLLTIADIMHTGDTLPKVTPQTPLKEALLVMTQKGLGMTAVVDEQDKLLGVFTDGDLRRAIDQALDLHNTFIKDAMTEGCKTIRKDVLAAEALKLMDDHKINGLLVTDGQQRLIGALNMHDILRAGVV